MSQDVHVVLRNLEIDDYSQLKSAMLEAYPQIDVGYWERKNIEKLLKVFPEGQLCVEVNDKVVGIALSIIVDKKKISRAHSYNEITGNETFSTHNPKGNVLYGIEVFVHPEYRGMRLARRLYDARKELCENLNLRSIMAGGRIPSYTDHADKMTPREYIDKVQSKQLFDPVLTFQLANGFQVRKILKDYLPGDEQSKEYATLLEWANIYYEPDEKLINQQKSIVRLGLVQWQMRTHSDFASLVDQVEFFVDAVSNYEADFLLFPEFFNAPLMAQFNHLGEAEAIRKLAGFTEPLLDKFKEFAVSYNINIITGSMPYIENDELKNVTFLCRRDGSHEHYFKIHITPAERSAWGVTGGDDIKVFDTDCGKIGIVICYDVEFPELSRIMADQGMNILFVPFLTDTQNGYMRVRNCAMARAIENECYVAIAGSVGNLPKVRNMDIQYAQSAVFTPSDFPFPTNGVKAETTPNTEMTLIVDVDLDSLKELHAGGSVRTMLDRRHDLYQLKQTRKGS
jgi:predicted amidohydrolase/ribosomal protein S18 acetylase RimI-like enzyme